MKRTMQLSTVALAILLFASSAYAGSSLIGDTVNSDIQPGPDFWFSNPTSAVVGDGFEFELELLEFGPQFEVDVGASAILMTWVGFAGGFSLGAGETYTLSDLDWVGEPNTFISAINLVSDIPGIDPADVSFTDHSVTIFLAGGVTYFVGDTILMEIKTVPGPASLVVVSGLGLIVGRKRRRTS